jgi:hypothetical protein
MIGALLCAAALAGDIEVVASETQVQLACGETLVLRLACDYGWNYWWSVDVRDRDKLVRDRLPRFERRQGRLEQVVELRAEACGETWVQGWEAKGNRKPMETFLIKVQIVPREGTSP